MNASIQTAAQINLPQTGAVDVRIVRGTVPPLPLPSAIVHPPSSLTTAVLALPVTGEPFIGTHEMFHVELMGDLNGHFTRLGRALERKDKRPADWAHIHDLAESLTRLVGLAFAESRTDAEGVVKRDA